MTGRKSEVRKEAGGVMGSREGRFSLKVTSEQIWRRQGSRPCRQQGTVSEEAVPAGRLWGAPGGRGWGEAERGGGELRERGGDRPGLCSCSENLAFSS